MNAGRIEQIASVAEIYNHPRTAFVAEFVSQANILDVQGMGRTASTPIGQVELDREITGETRIAIRPEQIGLVSPSEETAIGRVIALEFQGASALLSISVSEHVFRLTLIQNHVFGGKIHVNQEVGIRVVGPVVVLG